MIHAEELDGQSDLSKYIGQKVDHAMGIGKVVRIGERPEGYPNHRTSPDTPIFDTYAILIDLHCDRCGKAYPFFLFDGPSRGDWAYARENLYGPTLDLRNQMLYCDTDCSLTDAEKKVILKLNERGMVEAGKRETKYVSPTSVVSTLVTKGLITKHSTTARGYDIFKLTAQGASYLRTYLKATEQP